MTHPYQPSEKAGKEIQPWSGAASRAEAGCGVVP